MSNLNVGDRVEILSDATYEDGISVVGVDGCKSAIGKIGIIKNINIENGNCLVDDLGRDYGVYWWYDPDQLRKIEDNEDKKETEMELKYDFIDAEHKRMHNALIAAGWSCENDYLLNNNRHYSCDWFYSKDNFILFFNNDYQKVQTINLKKLDDLSFSKVADIIEAEVKNPNKIPNQPVQPNEVVDQPVETHEEIEYYPITKDNIVKVLEYNGFQYITVNNYSTKYKKQDHVFFVSLKEQEHLGYGYLQNEEDYYNCPQIIHPRLVKVIDFMNEFCPLEPLPKFDFVQYLLDNGWTSNNYNSACISSKRKTMMIVIEDYKFHHYDNSKQLYDCSEYNAKILVEMSNLGDKLSEWLS